ncbi:DUF368 domain-containing protein [Marinobacter daqiaonensis]|uniref:DUF368 domain-containing protein n=1 Tax=Marinobacter daqiaonensis TaxID=650891 RepID=UPI001D11D302|nr:DUF368 domain-containing protein [Marinobacter daqiaonensis]
MRHLAGIFLRGMAMGAADIVPGVSGGTIAFITGIYFRLLGAISAIPSAFLRSLVKGRGRRFWHEIDGSFLIVLLAGVLSSVVGLANAITWALETYPIALWSFFFGLILASVWHVLGRLKRWRWVLLVPLALGTAFAWWVTTLTISRVEPGALMFFLSGALAICAMILPGLSGSFILLVLGMYAPVLTAVRDFDPVTLLLFLGGCVVGLLSFARILGFALRRAHDPILALLTGFMIGALNRVWPWQVVTSWRTDSGGHQVPMEQISVTPMHYAEVTGEPAQVTVAVVALLIGIAVVLSGEWLAARFEREQGDDARV